MATFRLIIALAMVIHMTIASPIIDDKVDIQSKATDPNYRLPKSVMPKEFDITLTPNLMDMTFTGEAKILLDRIDGSVTDIYLHSKYLEYADVSLTPQHNPPITFQYRFIEPYDFLHMNLSRSLQNNTDYTITFKYNGTLQKDMKGFYQSYYKENGVKKYLGTTQFQPGHARKAFPCFDEPGYKAIYKISINCPANYTCISNMKVMDDSTSLVRFHPTPPMSSYLVAFIVSQFKPARQTNETKQFRVWARPEFGEQGTYAFDIGQELVNRMSTLLGIDYYGMGANMKMDQAAIPDFSAGAMENWGLLTYREAYLLLNPNETSTKYRQQIAAVLAHEIAHMWFGDYVTCQWWSETWLNEGFARYWQYFLTDMVDKGFVMQDQFVVSQLQAALLADTPMGSSPLTNPNVNSPDEVSGHFGTISYNKGASIIRMIEHWIGYNNFISGLNAYLRKYEYKNVVPENLFSHLENNATLATYNTTVDEVMGSFTRQNGYPIVHVTMDHTSGEVTLTQKRFVSSDETSDNLYSIPITYTIQNLSNFENTKPAFIMKNKVHKFSWPNGQPHGWIILNIQQTGFYRVSYDDSLLNMLLNTLNGKDRTDIDRLNRAQIVDDAMDMAREGHISFSKMFKIIDFLDFETEYAPWSAAFSGYSYMRSKFLTNNKLRTEVDKHILNEMGNLIYSLGFESKGNHLEKIFRANTLKLACDVGHKECIDDSVALYQKLKVNGTRVDPDLREHVYCNGLRHGNGGDYDFLWEKYLTSNVVNEQIVILGALGCTNDQDKVLQYLLRTIETDSDIRDQDRMTAFNSALGGNLENAETASKFLTTNIPKIKDFYGGNFLGLFTSIANRLNTESLEKFETSIETSSQLTDSEKESGKTSIANARKSMEWANSKSEDILGWLSTKYNSAGNVGASFTVLLIALAALFSNL